MKSRFAVTGAALALVSASAFPSIFPQPDQTPPLPPYSGRADSVGPELRTIVVTALNDDIFRVDNYLPGQAPAPAKTPGAPAGVLTGSQI